MVIQFHSWNLVFAIINIIKNQEFKLIVSKKNMHWYPLCNKHDNILEEVNFWINHGAVPVEGYNRVIWYYQHYQLSQ